MKNFAVIRKDRTILIKTPIPYIVDAYKNTNDVHLKEVCHSLDESTKFLYNVLKLLGISKKTAIAKKYTLNIHTGDELNNIAFYNSAISHKMFTVISTYPW